MLNKKNKAKGDASSSLRAAESLISQGDTLFSAYQYEDALEFYQQVLVRFGEARNGELGRLVRTARGRKGGVLVLLDRFEEANGDFDVLCVRTRYASDPQRALAQAREIIAKTLDTRAKTLIKEKRYEQALVVEESLFSRFGDDPPSEHPYIGLDALNNKAWLLDKLERRQEAITTYDEVIGCYGAKPELYAREKITDALVRKARLLRDDGHDEEAIAVVDELLTRVDSAEQPELRVNVARGLHNKAQALGSLGRWEEAITLDEDTIARFPSDDDPELVEVLAYTLAHEAYCLKKMGQWERSLIVWNKVAERYGDADTPALRSLVARALRERARLLLAMGQPAEGVVLAEALIERVGDEGPDVEQRQLFADALAAKGSALLADGRWKKAVESFDQLIDCLRGAQEPGLRRSMAIALNGKSVALDLLGDQDESSSTFGKLARDYEKEAFEIFDDMARQSKSGSGPQAREVLSQALYSKAGLLAELDRNSEALVVLDELIERFENDESYPIQEIVSSARNGRKEILSGASGPD